MSGETDLDELLIAIDPQVIEGDYVFCTVTNPAQKNVSKLNPLATFAESEGLSILIPQQHADEEDLVYHGVFKGITLSVHSSLDAIGLTAAVSARLAAHAIPANVIAAHYHDHVFVPREKATEALDLLKNLADQQTDSALTNRGNL